MDEGLKLLQEQQQKTIKNKHITLLKVRKGERERKEKLKQEMEKKYKRCRKQWSFLFIWREGICLFSSQLSIVSVCLWPSDTFTA